MVRLGHEAADWWAAQGVEVTRQGSLVITPGRDRRELDQFARRTTGHRMVTGADLAKLEPHVADRHDRALWFDGEAHIDPRAALAHLRTQLEDRRRAVRADRYGTGRPGDRLSRPRGTGRAARSARRQGRDDRAAQPRCAAFPARPPAAPALSALYRAARRRYLHAGRHPDRKPAARPRLGPLGDGALSAAYALHPAFGEAEVVEIGADARPAFPDNLPRITRKGDTLHVNGLFRHGFLLSPAVARQVAGLVLRDNERPELYHEDHA